MLANTVLRNGRTKTADPVKWIRSIRNTTRRHFLSYRNPYGEQDHSRVEHDGVDGLRSLQRRLLYIVTTGRVHVYAMTHYSRFPV